MLPAMWRSWQQTPTDDQPRWLGNFGSVTQAIIWVTVIAFAVQLVCDAGQWLFFERWLALSADGIRHGMIWQLVTYLLLHGGLWHILVNLLMFWFFGREVEHFVGARSFVRLYLCAGVAGGLLWLAFNWQSPFPVVGASAAVLGCVVAFATLFPEREITLLVFFVLPVTLKARTLALIAVAFDVVPLLSGVQTNIAHLAHLGGALVGYLYIKQLGFGVTPRWLAWTHRVRNPFRRPSRRARPVDDFMAEEIDPILDKISREGMQSLTRRERKVLESARDLMQKRQW
jgi:membrane associated rhomboid family serine protease